MRIACLLPRKEMVESAWQVLMKNNADWQALGLTIDYGPKFYALEWVEKIKSETPRPDIIVARGLHATLIKQHCTIPLVEIRLTAQSGELTVSIAPATPFRFWPTKVETFRAMTPGVHWPMAK